VEQHGLAAMQFSREGPLTYDRVVKHFSFRHVVVSDATDGEEPAAALAESALWRRCGRPVTAMANCGPWRRHGHHEDQLQGAAAVGAGVTPDRGRLRHL